MDGGKFKSKLPEVNTRAVSRRQNELILTISPTAILNFPTNSLLSSRHNPGINLRYFPFKFPATPWWHLLKTLVTPSLLCVHIHSLSSD
jgi:hypothetical protein